MTAARLQSAIDHLVVAARSLDEGTVWVEDCLGVAPAGGGRHDYMGTHNRVLGLGPGVYLEVIAIDPTATRPARPRWFALDLPEMRARLQRGPALIHWVARVSDIAAAAKAAPIQVGQILPATRGDYRWRITVPRDGTVPAEGVFPTLIQWDTAHPAAALPDVGCGLESLHLAHPRAPVIDDALRSIGLAEPERLRIAEGEPTLTAKVRTPRGVRWLPPRPGE
jgi:hypothetical protein